MGASCSRRETTASSGESLASASTVTPTTIVMPPTPSSSLPKGESVYQVDMNLTDQDGKIVPFDTFRGHPTIVTMFYATCRSACPLLVRDIKSLEEQVDPTMRDRMRILFVSFDPKRDTPAKLMEMVQKHKIDLSRWKMAAAPSDDAARELAAVLGYQFRQLPDGEFSHSARITLLDENGVVVGQADTLGQANTDLLPEIERRKPVQPVH
ncbi:MAG: SCO family protein [Polyangiaceae bacterium]|nr:SCO family protein [Polyangiaceae bacterium]